MKNQITIILFKICPTNRFSKAKSRNFHFHKNDVTCLLVQMADWPWRIMGARRTTDSWKNPSSSYYIGFIYCWRRVFQWASRLSLNPPTSPLQGCAKKHPFCRKWNIIWGWNPPSSFVLLLPRWQKQVSGTFWQLWWVPRKWQKDVKGFNDGKSHGSWWRL